MSGLVRGPTGVSRVWGPSALSRRVPYVGPWPVRCGESAAINKDKRESHRATMTRGREPVAARHVRSAGEDAVSRARVARSKLKTAVLTPVRIGSLSASRSSSNLPA